MNFLCRWARISNTWQANVLVRVNSAGWITAIEEMSPWPDASETEGPTANFDRAMPHDFVELPGAVLPAPVNVHSHAFQWGFAGLSEFRTASEDSFWTWRDQMFAFLEQLDPDRMYQVHTSFVVVYLQILFHDTGCLPELKYRTFLLSL